MDRYNDLDSLESKQMLSKGDSKLEGVMERKRKGCITTTVWNCGDVSMLQKRIGTSSEKEE
eukprot:1342252-Prorocentrum_lima.AAC.1